MRHKPDTIAFAQGWLGNQLEEAAKEQATEAGEVIGQQVLSQWKIIDEALDDLLKERAELITVINNIRTGLPTLS